MNPDNRWVQMADKVPWNLFEVKYAGLFLSDTGNVAKPLCMALGSLIIQNRFQYPDRELVEQITENPYLQYFVGLPGYQDTSPFDASTLVLFRKRITADMLSEANKYLLAHKDDDQPKPPHSGNGTDESSIPKEEGVNKGTLIIDATCAPVNIRYSQDISLLNAAREKQEYMIYRMCKAYGIQLPRSHRRRARKEYLAFAKGRKHTKKQIRTAIKRQISYVRRDIGYLERYFSQGYVPDTRDIPIIVTILKLYEQQEYMYKNKVHSVPDRIVSISQPWIRPIVVRGKVKAPVEFGAKLDVSIDEMGYGRLETVSFDAYNESGCLMEAVERYKTRTGHYPERVLADQIYRTRENRDYCKKHGIRLSGPKLGRPSQDAKADKKQEYQDNTDRIEVERFFSRSKRCYGMGCIVTKLKETQLTSIALSVFVSNLFEIQRRILLCLFWQCLRYMTRIGGYSLKVLYQQTLIKILGCYVTRLETLLESGIISDNEPIIEKEEYIDVHGEHSYRVEGVDVREYLDRFRDRILRIYMPEKIILHVVRGAEFYFDENREVQKFEPNTAGYFKKLNKMWSFMCEYLSTKMAGCMYIDISSGFLADEKHVWGLSPIHFQKEYYERVLEEISRKVCL